MSSEFLRRSIWVFHLNTGSCNACDIEILDVLTPYFDAERFGVKLVASPRHADAILLTGPVTREALPKVIRAIEAVPRPRILIVMGSCGVGGGIWHDTYNTVGGISGLKKLLDENGITVDYIYYVPGCPVRPESIIYAIGLIKGLVGKRVGAKIKKAEA